MIQDDPRDRISPATLEHAVGHAGQLPTFNLDLHLVCCSYPRALCKLFRGVEYVLFTFGALSSLQSKLSSKRGTKFAGS